MDWSKFSDEQIVNKIKLGELVIERVIKPELGKNDNASEVLEQWTKDVKELKQEWERRQLAMGPHDVSVGLKALTLRSKVGGLSDG